MGVEVCGGILYTWSLLSGPPWIPWPTGGPRTPWSPRTSWNICEGDNMTPVWSHDFCVIQ